jgi:site-specific DNA-methyltransferase (adenine-specific)
VARSLRHRRADTGRTRLSDQPGAGPGGVADLLGGGGVLLAPAMNVLRRLPDGAVDLIYVDPPFGTGQTRRLASIRTGKGTRTRRGFGGRSYRYEVTSTHSYRDDMPFAEYLAFLQVHLREARRVLKDDGSLYLHLDFHSAHHARLMLDDVFGAERFLNEIVWAYDYGGRPRDRWPRKHDTILWYAKGTRWTFNRDDVDRIPYMAPGLVGPEKAARGKLPTDVWWLTIVPTASRERTGYPTQKPESLLARIVRASSNPGDLVLDFFCGSGTTGAVAKRLGRRFLLVDENPAAIEIATRRLRQIEPGPEST